MWLLAALPLTAPYPAPLPFPAAVPRLPPIAPLCPSLPPPASSLPLVCPSPLLPVGSLPSASPPCPPLPSPPAVVRTNRRILHPNLPGMVRPTAIIHANRPPRLLGDRDVRIVLRTKRIPHGVSWRGAQSEPERCLLGPEAPSCTTLAVSHASPRPSRYASCVQLSHDCRGAGASRFDGWLTTGHMDVPAAHIDFACYRGISPLSTRRRREWRLARKTALVYLTSVQASG